MHLLPTAQYLRLQISFICQISVTCQITVICYDAKVKSRKKTGLPLPPFDPDIML